MHVNEDLRSSDTIRAAFERLRPRCEPGAPPAAAPPRLTPDEMEELKRFATFVRSAVDTLFGKDAAGPPRPFSSWSEEQRTLLTEIARTPYELHLNAGSLGRKLAKLGAIGPGGLDDDRYLTRYAGLCEPSALEKEVEGRPIWLWLRLHLMAQVSEQDWLRAANGLEPLERVDLARRALDNAYQLSRRWPLPADVTMAVERQDAAKLQAALIPVLEALSTDQLEHVLAAEHAEKVVVPGLIVLLCLLLARRGVALIDPLDQRLTASLELQTSAVIGRQLLALLPPGRRLALVQPMVLKPYNMDGWTYLDLLEPSACANLVMNALESFTRACRPEVSARATELIRGLEASLRDPLRELAAKNGPNAKLILDALEG